jgi:hypothetical protein
MLHLYLNVKPKRKHEVFEVRRKEKGKTVHFYGATDGPASPISPSQITGDRGSSSM